jgi:hypothetical protein
VGAGPLRKWRPIFVEGALGASYNQNMNREQALNTLRRSEGALRGRACRAIRLDGSRRRPPG